MTTVPSSLLLAFFQDATNTLNTCSQVKVGDSLVDIRKSLLQLQLETLNRVVATHNSDNLDSLTAEQVQQQLQTLGSGSTSGTLDAQVMTAMKDMNQAARFAFCRLVLRLECLLVQPPAQRRPNALIMSGKMPREHILEFFGLCNGAVQLENVKEHLRSGKPFFSDLPTPPTPPSIFPQKRLEQLQRLFLQAVGYDADFGTMEIKRIFFDPTSSSNSDLRDDKALATYFGSLVTNMNAALNTASLEATHVQHFASTADDGVTRVVSVEHSEVDGTDPQNLQQQQQRVMMARQAAALQQDILQELLNMDETTRVQKLKLAKDASEDFMKRAQNVPPGPQRVAFLRAMDPTTQRLLATHKLWTHRQMMLAANAGGNLSPNGAAVGSAGTSATTSK